MTLTELWDTDIFGFAPSSYSLAINLFLKALGFVYIFAYFPFLGQIKGLFGKQGIRPIGEFLEMIKQRFGKRRFYYIPTLLWIHASDAALIVLIWSGLLLATLLILGIYPALILFLLYLVHLSLTSAGQEFLGFGWETFIMEITLAACITVSTYPYNVFGWISLNFLLFRFMLQAGISKIKSGDKNWRNLTAIYYHYQSQPLPNTIAWYFHKLPIWFHKISTLLMFYVEIIVPFAIFSPPFTRLIACVQLIGLQLGIWLTGNLSYLNHLTIALCLVLIPNYYLEPYVSAPLFVESSQIAWQLIISLVGAAFLALQSCSLIVTFFPLRSLSRILKAVEPFHLAYPHGIFAVMTTKRFEIVIEGSTDGLNWEEYHFYYKVGDLAWRPRRVSPYQPRLDWQAWFLPFSHFWNEGWFQQFLVKLLQGSPPVLKLIKKNPFPEKPPLYIRALVYDYEFTTFQERAQSGNWWKRRLIGEYTAPIQLRFQET